MPVTPALWEAGVDGSPEVRSWGPVGQCGKTLSQLKISGVNWCPPVVPATLKAEAGGIP